MSEVTGAVTSLASQRGYLTGAARAKPTDLAMAFVRSNVAAPERLKTPTELGRVAGLA